MIITKTILQIKSDIQKISDSRAAKTTIALVPTMGALHDGHFSLIKKAQELADIVVVSIFVNQTQFNNANDYLTYPRKNEEDLKQLEMLNVDVVFMPDASEMFGDDFAFHITPTKLADCLCGTSRPGHFDGVALIVSKLFNIIRPDIAIFGQKDFQQLAIIKKLEQDLNLDVTIIAGETLRDANGLALSSRNQRLSPANLMIAAQIFKILSEIRIDVRNGQTAIPDILSQKSAKLLEAGFQKIDYLEIREEDSLELVTQFDANTPSRIFLAAHLDDVRLIDNMKL